MIHNVTMLGTGLIGMFYTMAIHSNRSRDKVSMVYSRTAERAKDFAEQWDIARHTTNMEEAINNPETDVVVIGLPNNLHEEAVRLCVAAGKAILCTKPLGRTAEEAKRMLDMVEEAGIFGGYLEDLVYTPKTLKAIQSMQNGALGKILWARSREAHSGPHSDWFWDKEISGGGAIVDLGCHCIEIARNYIGKDVRPVEVMCWADTQVHPIEAEDHAIGLVKYASGAIGQFEVSWCFRGGMDLRDEVSGTEGTVWMNHWLRTGFEMFTATGEKEYMAEKAESETGWLFPVGDEIGTLGYLAMFTDMFDSMENGTQPMESFYDGYVVNAIMDAAYRSAETKQWEPVMLEDWRGLDDVDSEVALAEYDAEHFLVKQEKMPDSSTKLILKKKMGGKVIQKIV